MSRALGLLAPLVFVALLLGVCELAVRALKVPPYLLPAPSEILLALAANAPVLAASAWNTLKMALGALLIASVTATSSPNAC